MNLKRRYVWMIMVCVHAVVWTKKNGVMLGLVGDIIVYHAFVLSDLFVLI